MLRNRQVPDVLTNVQSSGGRTAYDARPSKTSVLEAEEVSRPGCEQIRPCNSSSGDLSALYDLLVKHLSSRVSEMFTLSRIVLPSHRRHFSQNPTTATTVKR